MLGLLNAVETLLAGDAPMSSSERLRVRIVSITCFVMLIGQMANLVSMSLSYESWSLLHTVAIGYLTVTIAIASLLRRTRSATLFGVLFSLLFLAAIGVSAASAPGGVTTSAGINTSLLPGLVATMALIGLLGSRKATIFCFVLSSLMIWGLFGLSMGLWPNPLLGDAPYHRAFQAQLALGMTALVTAPVGEIVFATLDTLEAERDRAEDAEAVRADYVATVSHEVRTPLSGVLGLSDLLLKTGLSGPQENYAKLIHSSATNMLDIVNDLLDTAKADEDTVTVASRPLDIAEVFEDVRSLFAQEAQRKGLWIGTDIKGDPAPGLLGDPRYLRQVLSNLTSNAIKFTPHGGVRIGAGVGELKDGVQPVVFYVQDTGPGIAPDDQARIFERFTQTETARHSDRKGSGLGLSICKRLVEAMGGQIGIRSRDGHGTAFHFTLALTQDDTARSKAA